MRRQARTALIVARAWRGARLLAAALLVVAVARLWRLPVDVPGRDGVAEVVWPLAPVVIAAVVPGCATTVAGDLERTAARGPRRLAGLAILGLAAVAVLASFGGGAGDRGMALVLGRNAALLAGIALLAVVAVPPGAAWVPVTLVPMLTWLHGARGVGVAPARWAWLLQPPSARPALLGSVALLVAGAGAFALLGPCGRRWGWRRVR